MKITDLILSKDGSISLTKVAACTAHLSMAINFWLVSFGKAQFIWDLWLIYAGLTIGHASADKGMKIWQAIKERNGKEAGQ